MSFSSWAKSQIPNKIHTANINWDKKDHPIKPGTIVTLTADSKRYNNGIVVTRTEAEKHWGKNIAKGAYGNNTVWVNWSNHGILQSSVEELRKERD